MVSHDKNTKHQLCKNAYFAKYNPDAFNQVDVMLGLIRSKYLKKFMARHRSAPVQGLVVPTEQSVIITPIMIKQ